MQSKYMLRGHFYFIYIYHKTIVGWIILIKDIPWNTDKIDKFVRLKISTTYSWLKE